MNAAVIHQFAGTVTIEDVPRPVAPLDGVVIEVKATGVCRSDWHAWKGHDPSIVLPHVPGHEFAGVIAEVGAEVSGWAVGDRVTVPFCCGCGTCVQCQSGDTHLCDQEYQPGFTGWGSFAEYVAIPYAETNLIRLPDDLDFVAAAGLGCRFMTAFHALTGQGRAVPGEWLAVHGCGGVGMSAVQIGVALGLRVIAIDINDTTLALARKLGADMLINAIRYDPVASIRAATGAGAHLSMDALGSARTASNSISCLRKKGRHLQVGLVNAEGEEFPIPMSRVISMELEILGTHGMPVHRYPDLLALITSGAVDPRRLVGKTIALDEVSDELEAMTRFATRGLTVVVN